MKRYFQNNFALDLRSLACFRICLGLLILIDVILRLNHFTSHYTEDGLAPRELLLDASQADYKNWSLFFLNESTGWAVLLFTILIYSTICFILGFKTKLHTICLWLLVVSMQARCPYICFGADVVVRVLLFWCLFLPLGRLWSFDAYRKKLKRGANVKLRAKSYYSVAIVAFTLQIAMIYWFNAISKGHPSWRIDNTAVELTLNLESFSTVLGTWLLGFTSLLKLLTIGALLLEELGPLLLFIPIFRNLLRTIAVFLFIGFHLGLALTMHLGIFPYICMIAWIPFLPNSFWQKFNEKEREDDKIELSQNHWESVFCSFMCFYIFMWNTRNLLKKDSSWSMPSQLNVIADITRVKQKWHLFAPRPATKDLWLLVGLQGETGVQLEFLGGGDAGQSVHGLKKFSLFYANRREASLAAKIWIDKCPLRVKYLVKYLAQVRGVDEGQVNLYFIEKEHFHPNRYTKFWKIWSYESYGTKFDELDFMEIPHIEVM